jgi:hypothetical protein
MRIRRIALPLAMVVLLVPSACSSDDEDPQANDATSTSSTPEPEASEPVEAPLEGAWTADITPEAFTAYIVSAGYDESVATEILGPDNETLPGPEFRLEFLGDRFRLSYAPTDEQFMSGTFTLADDAVTFDDEAPVGLYTFAFAVAGDELRLSDGTTSNAEIELAPGIPDFLPGAAFMSSSPWTRAS